MTLPPVTVQTLEAFSDAWNRHDLNALMSFMTDDCVFETAAGPEACGTRHVGLAAVRQAFAMAWHTVPDAQWRNGVHHVMGNLYGCLPAIGANPHRVVKKSAAALYPALLVVCTGYPALPTGPDVIR